MQPMGNSFVSVILQVPLTGNQQRVAPSVCWGGGAASGPEVFAL